jgi:choline dehydrogenase
MLNYSLVRLVSLIRDLATLETRNHHYLVTYVDEKFERVSSEAAYLTPDVMARPNLTVAIHATVTRILFENQPTGKPRAVGVEFAKTEDGPRYQVKTKKEVILS